MPTCPAVRSPTGSASSPLSDPPTAVPAVPEQPTHPALTDDAISDRSIMTSSRTPFAVIGATGNQGSAAVDELLAAGAPVRALVRHPDADAASALRDRGVEVVAADQEDRDALERALAGTAGLFFFTTFEGPDGTEGEARRGITVADAAARAGVPRVVYSSVGGAERTTGVPHFESKRRVEERLEQLDVPATFVRPAFFMENLLQQLPTSDADDFVLRFPMPADLPMQMIAVRDVGRTAARLLLDPDLLAGSAIEIAGDELTMDQVAATIGEVYGIEARFEALPVEVLASDADMHAMFSWFATSPSYLADRPGTRKIVPEAADLRGWLETQRRRPQDPAAA
ncbi:NmrA/HSCARG family protein [Curtobacterium sp. MCBD17_028]|nr:NmrA/HSCARG family protein [Curtobacterium sp. MCBD17_028]